MTTPREPSKSGATGAAAPRRGAFRLSSLERPARHLTVAKVESGAPFAFFAGQFARVRFDGERARDLSIASRPGARILEFHIRDLPRHGASLFERLTPGMAVGVEGPFGTGYLREEFQGPILLIAGGSGIAPVKSIVETALAKGMRQPIHLYFGVRDEPDLYLESHFEQLARAHSNLRFVPVLSAEGAGARRRGLVGAAAAADFADLSGFKAYVFGPPPMVRETVTALRALGIAARDIHGDEPADPAP